MGLWARLAKEKIHFFWTVPVVNMLLNITANIGVIYLVIKAGRWEALIAIPIIIGAWLALYLLGRKRLIREEVSYSWQLSRNWMVHEAKMDEVLERLKRLEEKK